MKSLKVKKGVFLHTAGSQVMEVGEIAAAE